MLNRLHVQGFKSLVDVDVRLTPHGRSSSCRRCCSVTIPTSSCYARVYCEPLEATQRHLPDAALRLPAKADRRGAPKC